MSIAWIPLNNELDYQKDVVAKAKDYGCSWIQFSHSICHNADDLLDNPNKANLVRQISDTYKKAEMPIWCWTHEFKNPPAEFIKNKLLDIDHPELWIYLEQKYDRFFKDILPDIEGIILTFAETSYPVYKDKVISKLSVEDRTAKLINTMNRICKKHGKKLAIRDFVYKVNEIVKLCRTIAGIDDDVIVMSKCVPHDWEPFYPDNPTIGVYGKKRQWVEFDFGHEYEGQHLYPFAEVEKNLGRLQRAYQKGVREWNLRLDRGSKNLTKQSAIYNPWGQLELLTMKMFEENKNISADDIWNTWESYNFSGARVLVETSTNCVYKFLFARKFWIANHSNLPSFEYASSHIVGGNADRLPQWTDDPIDLNAEQNFISMPKDWLDYCLSEADEAVELADKCSQILQSCNVNKENMELWTEAIKNLNIWANLFADYKRAYFRLDFFRKNPDAIARDEVQKYIIQFENSSKSYSSELGNHFVESGQAVRAFESVVNSLNNIWANII